MRRGINPFQKQDLRPLSSSNKGGLPYHPHNGQQCAIKKEPVKNWKGNSYRDRIPSSTGSMGGVLRPLSSERESIVGPITTQRRTQGGGENHVNTASSGVLPLSAGRPQKKKANRRNISSPEENQTVRQVRTRSVSARVRRTWSNHAARRGPSEGGRS